MTSPAEFRRVSSWPAAAKDRRIQTTFINALAASQASANPARVKMIAQAPRYKSPFFICSSFVIDGVGDNAFPLLQTILLIDRPAMTGGVANDIDA